MADLAILEFAEQTLDRVPLAIQQRVEIGRALARDARVFLFDEPNSALTQEESNDLFRRMHGLAAAGRVVVLVSHRIARARPPRRPRRPDPRRALYDGPSRRDPDAGGHRRRPRRRAGLA